MKTHVPMLICLLGGLVMIASYFAPPLQALDKKVVDWFNLLAAIGMILGAANLVKNQLRRISDRQPGWGYAAITLAAFCLTLAVGLLKVGVSPVNGDPALSAWTGEFMEAERPFWWLYTYVMTPITATMFALLSFFVASASFRAFRAKNTEATILLVTAFIILLGRTYAGTFLTGWLPDSLAVLRTENMTQWIMTAFTTAGMRAILIGIALGTVATSLKVLLGIDRSYLGSE